MSLTAERLRELLHYEPDTGVFSWRSPTSRRTKAGSEAGTLDKSGYVRIRLDKAIYPAHRLAFLYMTGSWPAHHVDHVNGWKTENMFSNLRECSSAENNQNRSVKRPTKTGVKGVRLSADGTFEARIAVEKRRISLGTFPDIESARRAYAAAAIRYHGEFAREA